MICPYCKKQISDNNQFCPECGQAVNMNESSGHASATYWNSVEKEAERDNKVRIEAENKLQEKKKAKKRVIISTLIGVAIVAIVVCYFSIIRPAQQYDSALALFESGEFHDSLQIFESLGSYKDSAQQVELCQDKIREEDYSGAIDLFEAGNYSDAIDAFRDLGDYQSSAEYIGESEVALIKDSNTNEVVTLGTYGGTPIEWIILSRDETSALLLSKYYVTSKIANENDRGEYGKYLCWSGSTLRSWLNSDFIEEAFPSSVANLLITNTIQTDEYDVPNYDGGSAVEITVTTEDKVYIPSKADVEHYKLSPTSLMGSSGNTAITGWLRDRGHGIAFQVSYEPDGSYGSEWHFYSSYGIRPIIRVSLDGEATIIHTDSTVVVDIPPNAFNWGDHYYACFNNCSSWEEAENYCESRGGHLATITSPDENDAVFSYLLSCGYESGYFGYTDNIDEGSWYWVNGETSGYTNWHSGEPNAESSNEDYAMFYYKFDDGTWNDGNFGNGTANDDAIFICEWD